MWKVFLVVLLYFVKDARMKNCKAENNYDWSYHGTTNGPSQWSDSYPDCGKSNQSPVDIEERDVLEVPYPELEYTSFDKPITKATVQNLGWTVMIVPEDDVKRYIHWGMWNYTLESIHFHFGPNYEGAEHTIDGTTYPMEIHFNISRKEEKNPYKAMVAAIFDMDSSDNDAFKSIADVLSDIKYRDDSTDLGDDLDLSKLLPESGAYYTYDGSESNPPCDPDYTWFVLKDIGDIGSDQMDNFLSLYSVGEDDASDDCLMGPNNRDTQELQGRRIFESEKSK